MTTITGGNYDSGEYEKALDAALEAAGYSDLRAQQAERRASGDPKQLGIGVSAYVEVTAPVGLHVEWGACEVHEDGSATVAAGTSVHGQGHQTAFAMLASEVLGIPMEKITLVNSDTAKVPRGSGTLGSRSLQTGGSAIYTASQEVLGRAKQIAAHLLEASADDIEVGDGGLQVAGVPAKAVSWGELAAASNDTSKLPDGMEAGALRHELDFDGQDSTFPFGAHVSVVEVDTETGGVTMLRHVRGRRLRSHPQPAARARPAARWYRPGRGAGVVRARAVRRRRQPDHVEPDGLRDPVGRRAVQFRDVEHPDRQPSQPARRQGHRRVRARSAQRRRSTTRSATRCRTSV